MATLVMHAIRRTVSCASADDERLSPEALRVTLCMMTEKNKKAGTHRSAAQTRRHSASATGKRFGTTAGSQRAAEESAPTTSQNSSVGLKLSGSTAFENPLPNAATKPPTSIAASRRMSRRGTDIQFIQRWRCPARNLCREAAVFGCVSVPSTGLN